MHGCQLPLKVELVPYGLESFDSKAIKVDRSVYGLVDVEAV